MVWLVALTIPVLGTALFLWAYGCRFSQLSGPWIAKGNR